jgi:hypothetical protein
MNQLARALDSEIKRVAKDEDKTMEEIVSEVAELIGKHPRHVYNYRSGKWPLPSDKIAILCKRFGSYSLANAIKEEASNEEIPIPDQYDIGELAVEGLRRVCDYHSQLMDAFKQPGGIDKATLNILDQQLSDIVQRERLLYSIAEVEHDRAQNARRHRA